MCSQCDDLAGQLRADLVRLCDREGYWSVLRELERNVLEWGRDAEPGQADALVGLWRALQAAVSAAAELEG